MATNVVQQRALQQARYGFEKEMENYCKDLKKLMNIKFDYTQGNVKQDTQEGHMSAKFSAADLTIVFKQFTTLSIEGEGIVKDTFPIDTPIYYNLSLKEIKSRVPRRVWQQTLQINKFSYEDFFILDFNDYKDILNSNYILLKNNIENKKYLIIKDEVFGGYYLYDYRNLKKNLTEHIYLDYEGFPIHEKMKVLITKNTNKFNNLKELFMYFINKAHAEMQIQDYKEMQSEMKNMLKSIKKIKRAPISDKKAGKYKGYKWVVNCSVSYIN